MQDNIGENMTENNTSNNNQENILQENISRIQIIRNWLKSPE